MKSSSVPTPAGNGKKNKKPSAWSKFIITVVKFVIITFIAISCAAAGILGGVVLGFIKTAPKVDFDKIIMGMNKTTFIYDVKGNVMAKLTGKDNKDSVPVAYKNTPQFLHDAIISIEDERFETHPGIDIKRTLSAGFSFLTNNKSRSHGGSTLTQQVIKNITKNDDYSVKRKVQEWVAAFQLEKKMDKWQILEMYMNYSYFGNSCVGVQSASRKYFGKDVADLSLAQCALLAGVTNSPGKYNPMTEKGRVEAKRRQETILGKMLELGKIDQSQYELAIKDDLQYAQPTVTKKSVAVQSYFVDRVISDVKEALMEKEGISSSMALNLIYNNGYKIYTTMDPDIQAAMDEVFMNEEYFPQVNRTAQNLLEHPQAAMVILDAQNGQVKAIYGGYGKKEASNTLNRATSIKRQPGSSIKPIAVYAPAIDLRKITAATVIEDVPVYMRGGDTSVSKSIQEREYPKNYDGKHYGLTSVRNALKASVNVIAARIWKDYLGADNCLEYLKKVGIDRPTERYLSVVMGGLNTGVSPLQMAAAYVPFAHKGMYYEPTTFTLVKDSDDNEIINKVPKYEAVYSEQTASIMVNLMKEVTSGKNSPYQQSGTAAEYVTEAKIGMPVAGKTGTTSDNIDKWFVGYTPYYVAATWYGYDNSGSSPITLKSVEYSQALKIWSAVMKEVHKDLEKKDFTKASGLVKKKICIYSGKIATDLCAHDPRGNATREEYFIKGTEPRDDDVCTLHIKENVCTASKDVSGRNLLAGPNCPPGTVVEKVFIQRLTPYVPTKPGEIAPKDLIYELPAGEYCTVHGADNGSQVETTPTPTPSTANSPSTPTPAATQSSVEATPKP